ncbi:MAG: putative sulfate/molybdate transporter [Candidatus Thermochlorobacter sp.]
MAFKPKPIASDTCPLQNLCLPSAVNLYRLARMITPSATSRLGIRFDRNEWNGAFGDIGTDLPLLAGMILTAQLDTASVLILFGAMQLFTGFFYRLPMPVQPLKAMAALVISQNLSGNILFGGGLAIGILMGILALSGALEWIAKWTPLPVVRGLQLGLALQLAQLALKDYTMREGPLGYALALIAFSIILVSYVLERSTYPAALLVIFLGFCYALFLAPESRHLPIDALTLSLHAPALHHPLLEDITQGFLLLALPQIALSIGNSILATARAAQDLFPERAPRVKKIGLTYAIMNLIAPFFSGAPVCHGAGGLAGHYAFGARTGGSVIIYGAFYLVLGIFFSSSFDALLKAFPLPILGVLLLFEALALFRLAFSASTAASLRDLMSIGLTAFLAIGLPYGFLFALVVGTLFFYLSKSRSDTSSP